MAENLLKDWNRLKKPLRHKSTFDASVLAYIHAWVSFARQKHPEENFPDVKGEIDCLFLSKDEVIRAVTCVLKYFEDSKYGTLAKNDLAEYAREIIKAVRGL